MKKDVDWVANMYTHPEIKAQQSPQETANRPQKENGAGAKGTQLPDPPSAAEATAANPHRCLRPLGLPKPHVEPPVGMGLAVTVKPQKV